MRAIRKYDMLAQDALIPDWHETTRQTVVDEYFYDSPTSKDFYVYSSFGLVFHYWCRY